MFLMYQLFMRKTREIHVGLLKLGADNPVRVQSMTNTAPHDYSATLAQVMQLVNAGCELVRLSVVDEEALNVLTRVKKAVPAVPYIADIHFRADLACMCLEKGVDCIRINPGNIGSIDGVKKIVELAKKKDLAIRIGVNSGSLEKDLLEKHGTPTAEALAESALRWIDFVENMQFRNFKVSIKSHDGDILYKSNKIISERSQAPIHLGLTEAGPLISGLVRSTVALTKLLEQKIGDTIRISLSSDPVHEVIAGMELLKTLGLRKSGLDIVSCPTCARTSIDVIGISEKLQMEFANVNLDGSRQLKVAVMGCYVNGPGEARGADLGIAGAPDCALLYVNGEVYKKVTSQDAYSSIVDLIREKLNCR
jgi:(E)-4-hydroxy-3-methylbut-2-enyl-diphosphate synthase